MIGKFVKDCFNFIEENALDYIDIAADQYGFDAQTSAANRLKAIKARKDWEKLSQDWEKRNQEVDK